MVLPNTGNPLSLRLIGDEYGMSNGRFNLSTLYHGAGVVPYNAGSNAAVPSSGAMRFSDFHGTASLDHEGAVTVSLPADYTTVIANGTAAQVDAFKLDAIAQLAEQVGLPQSRITITDITPGSIVVRFSVRMPATGVVNVSAAAKIAVVAAATIPQAVFGAAFCAKYAVSAVAPMSATSRLPPTILLGGYKAVSSMPTSATPTAVSLLDLFSTQWPPLSFSVQSAAYGNATVSGSTLSLTGAYRAAPYQVYVTATDARGKTSAAASVGVTEIGPPAITTSPVPALAVSNGTTSPAQPMSAYFSDAAYGSVLMYAIVANPESSAFLTSGALVVAGANRGKTYVVQVRAANQYGGTATVGVSVTEAASAVATPVITALLGATAPLTTASVSYALPDFFSGASLTFAVTTNPQSSASIVGGTTLRVTGNCRAVSYGVVVTATDASGGTAQQTLTVDEAAAPPLVSANTLPAITALGNGAAATTDLAAHFSDPLGYALSYAVTADPNANATISGSVLTVTGAYRGTTPYSVTVRASTATFPRSATASVSVSETWAAPAVTNPGTLAGTTTSAAGYTYTFVQSATQTGTITWTISNATLSGWLASGTGVLTVPANTAFASQSVTLTATGPTGLASTAVFVLGVAVQSAPALPGTVLYELKANSLTASPVTTWGLFSQQTASMKPSWFGTGGYNNGKYVNFGGANGLNATSPMTIAMNTGGGLSFALLFKVNANSAGGWDRILEIRYGAGWPEAICINRHALSNDLMVQIYNANGHSMAQPVLANCFNPANGWKLVVFRYRKSDNTTAAWSGSSTTPFFTGAAAGTPSDATFTWVNLCHDNATTFANAQIGGMALFQGPITDADVTSIFSYYQTSLAATA
jgi:hypothetical protein